MMIHPAAVDALEVDQVRVSLPRDLVDELRAYDDDLVWTIKRALSVLLFEEERQAEALAKRRK